MDSNGFIYAANMTNALAKEIPESKWDKQLISEVGSLRKLFTHIVRVRDTYKEGIRSGNISFPGTLPSNEKGLIEHLERSVNELAHEFKYPKNEAVKMGEEHLSLMELLNTLVQHEGIHQGQYFVALKQAGLKLPNQWIQEWDM